MSDEQTPINGEMPKAKRRRPRLPHLAVPRPRVSQRLAAIRGPKVVRAGATAEAPREAAASVPTQDAPNPAAASGTLVVTPAEPVAAIADSRPATEADHGPRVELLPEEERPAASAEPRRRARVPHPRVPHPSLPAPLERAAFTLQEKVVWPVEDRLGISAPRVDRRIVAGGGAAMLAAAGAVAVVIALSSGGSSSTATTTPVAAAPAQPLAAVPVEPTPKESKPAGPTLHGAAPVFTPAPAKEAKDESDKRVRLSASERVAAPQAEETATEEATAGTSDLSSPATDRISSDPRNSKPATTATDARIASAPVTIPDGPPAGPKALKVAKQFAQGFVVYETGGEEAEFKDDFDAAATPQLTEALLQRPPHQPAGVKVPRAKVVNVVAGPSQGTVYKVSVSLLRVGVTSELRLDMEQLKPGEWRVTNVLG